MLLLGVSTALANTMSSKNALGEHLFGYGSLCASRNLPSASSYSSLWRVTIVSLPEWIIHKSIMRGFVSVFECLVVRLPSFVVFCLGLASSVTSTSIHASCETVVTDRQTVKPMLVDVETSFQRFRTCAFLRENCATQYAQLKTFTTPS